MNKKEIIDLTEKWLNGVPDIRNKIKLIDASLEDSICSGANITKLKKERHRLNTRLFMIIEAVSVLEDDNQRIICYRYFDKLQYNDIALRLGCSYPKVKRRIEKNLLSIGRALFGFEDEFWGQVVEIFGTPRNISENLLFKVMKSGV